MAIRITATNSDQFSKLEEFKDSLVADFRKIVSSISFYAVGTSIKVVRQDLFDTDTLRVPIGPSQIVFLEKDEERSLEFSYKWGVFIVPLKGTKKVPIPKIHFTTAFVEKSQTMTGQ